MGTPLLPRRALSAEVGLEEDRTGPQEGPLGSYLLVHSPDSPRLSSNKSSHPPTGTDVPRPVLPRHRFPVRLSLPGRSTRRDQDSGTGREVGGRRSPRPVSPRPTSRVPPRYGLGLLLRPWVLPVCGRTRLGRLAVQEIRPTSPRYLSRPSDHSPCGSPYSTVLNPTSEIGTRPTHHPPSLPKSGRVRTCPPDLRPGILSSVDPKTQTTVTDLVPSSSPPRPSVPLYYLTRNLDRPDPC